MVGVAVGLTKVAWVPVEQSGKLQGILMAGSVAPNTILPTERMTAVAAKLAIALAFEDEKKLAKERRADLTLCNRVLEGLADQRGLENWLTEIVESCISSNVRMDGPNAVFAFLGRLQERSASKPGDGREVEKIVAAPNETELSFLRSREIAELVRRTLQSRRTAGVEVQNGGTEKTGLRVVCIPVAQAEERAEVMLAGFRSDAASLSALERIELRARLASAVLAAVQERNARVTARREQDSLLGASSTAVVVLADGGQIVTANHAARMLLQLPPRVQLDEPEHKISGSESALNLLEYFSATSRQTVNAWLRGELRGDAIQSVEVRGMELECGAKVRLERHSNDGGRQTVSLVPVGAATAERESEISAELLNLAEWLDQGVVIYDARNRIRLMNLRFAQLAGLAVEEIKKCSSLEELIERMKTQSAEPESFARNWQDLAVRLEGGDREEVHLVRPVARVLERASRPMLDAKQERIGRIELYKDLTAQRVFHAKLLQTERMATLGQTVSGVAHELSNPLTSILGYAQRLLQRYDASPYFEELRKIFAEAERAGAILRRMLLAARETGPERRPVSLNQLVQQTVDLQRFSLAAERIRVEPSLDALLPNVRGDFGQLQQVLINLIGNARQAIESQGYGGTIRIRTERGPDGQVWLQVSDSGPGIPESILPRIFDPFFTTKPAGVGTGLGLSIVLSLVREHGGKVKVESPRGGGATFTVELPAAERQDPSSPVTALRHATSDPGLSEFRSRPAGTWSGTIRALVIEDELTVSQLIADVLRDEGFEVETLLDGRHAKDQMMQKEYDLIVCDMKIPRVDGQSLYESLGAEREAIRKKFLFVTGDALGAKTQGFLVKHKIPHLAKPFRVEELLDKVHQVLQPASLLRKNSATTG
ncbi:MAG: hypothetical protein NVS9B14_11000 [Candidatus Acidiferrum sp.]